MVVKVSVRRLSDGAVLDGVLSNEQPEDIGGCVLLIDENPVDHRLYELVKVKGGIA